METKENILRRLITPRRLIEAGLVVGSFALPALLLFDISSEVHRPVEQQLLIIGTFGLATAISSVVVADPFLELWEMSKRFGTRAGTLEEGNKILDAGVPVVGVEEVEK